MNFIAFDLETTGTNPDIHRIVELGAVRFENFKAVDQFDTLVNPECSIPPDASRVSGITDDMVKDQPVLKDALPGFTAFCGNLPMVAHNAVFDYKFVYNALEELKLAGPTGDVLDTFALSKKIFTGLPNYKLATLVRHFNFESGVFHRAAEDASYCGLVFCQVIKTLMKTGHPYEVRDIKELMALPEMRFPAVKKNVGEQLGLF